MSGIADATTANNAALAGSWIPALVFGIPGDSVTAIVIGVLLMKGITPGPMVFVMDAGLVNAIFVVFIASVLIPLPATNTLPGIGVAIASIGLITRDGVLVLAGLAIGTAWIQLLVVGIPMSGPTLVDLFKQVV